MKMVVNGNDAVLEPSSSCHIDSLPDRLLVRGPEGTFSALVVRNGPKTLISYRGTLYEVEAAQTRRAKSGGGTGEFKAPMPGMVVEVLVTEGQPVSRGQKLLVLEAMKTQQAVNAPFDGTVSRLSAKAGGQVSEGDHLVTVSAAVE